MSVTLPIGKTIALYNPTHKRWIRMNERGGMDTSQVSETPGFLHGKWTWERFHVTDGGNGGAGTIALYSPTHKRFIRMNSEAKMDTSQEWDNPAFIHPKWSWERFTITDGGNGTLALYNPTHRRFVRMNNEAGMDTSQEWDNPAVIHGKWTWERFTLLVLD